MDICLYMRKSTNMQENSIESQQKMLRAYAKSHKMVIVNEYIDEGISGRQAAKRPAFMQMIEDSSRNMFEAVLIYDSSRFARNLEESIVYKSLLKRNNVTLISATEPTLDDDTSLITDALLGAMNEMYSRKLSKAVKRGMEFKAQQGYVMGLAPFGYKKANSTGIPDINEDEAKIIRLIFDLFTSTNPTFVGVAKKLNRSNITKRHGSMWESKDIKRILKKPIYAGDIVWKSDGQVLCEGKHKPIISKEKFEEAAAIIAKMPKTKTRDNSTYRHWLSGIFHCGLCGRVMALCPHPTGNHYFRCRANSIGLCKPSVQISVKRAEKLVTQLFNDIVYNTEKVDFTNVIFSAPKIDNESVIEEQIEKLHKRLERYSIAYSDGIDTLEEYKGNKLSVTQKIESLRKELDNQQTEVVTDEIIQTFKQIAKEVLALLDKPESTIIEKNCVVRQMIHQIVYSRVTDSATVFFNY